MEEPLIITNYQFRWENESRIPEEDEFVCIVTRDVVKQEAKSEFDQMYTVEYLKNKTNFAKLREFGNV